MPVSGLQARRLRDPLPLLRNLPQVQKMGLVYWAAISTCDRCINEHRPIGLHRPIASMNVTEYMKPWPDPFNSGQQFLASLRTG